MKKTVLFLASVASLILTCDILPAAQLTAAQTVTNSRKRNPHSPESTSVQQPAPIKPTSENISLSDVSESNTPTQTPSESDTKTAAEHNGTAQENGQAENSEPDYFVPENNGNTFAHPGKYAETLKEPSFLESWSDSFKLVAGSPASLLEKHLKAGSVNRICPSSKEKRELTSKALTYLGGKINDDKEVGRIQTLIELCRNVEINPSLDDLTAIERILSEKLTIINSTQSCIQQTKLAITASVLGTTKYPNGTMHSNGNGHARPRNQRTIAGAGSSTNGHHAQSTPPAITLTNGSEKGDVKGN